MNSAGHIIGHGVDIVEIARIAQMLDEHGERLIDRCFSYAEQLYAEAGGRAERYAVRFACKEAVMKVLGTGWRDGIGWRDVEVVKDPAGRPHISLTGRCAELAREQGIDCWQVSLSHSGGFAIASVIGCAAAKTE